MNHGVRSTYTNGGCRCEECRQAHNEYLRGYNTERYRRRRRAAVERLGGRCVWCGTTENLTFDHIDTTRRHKLPIVTLFAQAADEVVFNEIELCQLLCSSCHGRKTIQEAGHCPTCQCVLQYAPMVDLPEQDEEEREVA